MYITITCEDGSPIVCPLWQLPQFVTADVEKKKDHIAALKAEAAAAEAAKAAAEAAKRAEEIRVVEGLDTPFDLTGGGEF